MNTNLPEESVFSYIGMANVQSIPVATLKETLQKDEWVWDASCKPDAVVLSSNLKAGFFHTDPVLDSTGTAGIRGSKGFVDGEHYWEVSFLEPPCGHSIMIGVGTLNSPLQSTEYTDLLGKDKQSWGLSYKGKSYHNNTSTQYCDAFFDQSTVLGIHLNLYIGTLTYYKDGQSLGVAFRGLNSVGEPLFPMITSTAAESELEVGTQLCRYLSLQEKCCLKIAKHLKEPGKVDLLPLPKLIKAHLHELQTS